MLCIPAFAYGQAYTYSKLIATKYGNDNFAFDKAYCVNVSGGEIELKKDTLRIDGHIYVIKPKRQENTFKAKKSSFEFVYRNQQLAAIRQLHYNETLLYIINEQAPFVATP